MDSKKFSLSPQDQAEIDLGNAYEAYDHGLLIGNSEAAQSALDRAADAQIRLAASRPLDEATRTALEEDIDQLRSRLEN